MMMPWKIRVEGSVATPLELTFQQMATWDDGSVRPGDLVPGVEGDAVALKEILRRSGLDESATHLIFYAADDFQADIPLTDLNQAFLLYRQNGQPLKKGYPARLYVPDGSSNCLNVKSVVRIEAVSRKNGDAAQEASFGFKNVVKPEELMLRK